MTVLSMKMIRAHDGRQLPFDGTCTDRQIKDISFPKLLGIELVARTRETDLLPVSKEMFVLLAAAHNDKAATQAFDAVRTLTLTLKGQNCISLKIPYEEFNRRARAEEEILFDWLDSVYWGFPLYTPVSDEDGNCNPGFWVNANLPETKKRVVACVADLWDGKDDTLGLKAFSFLCDCFDPARLRNRSPKILEAVRACRDQHERIYHAVTSYQFSYPEDETKFVLEMIKSALPQKLDIIVAWLKKLSNIPHVPDRIQKIFRHAYVNAGGEVVTPTPA